MCGITGVVSWGDTDEQPARAVSAMVAALAHRGPDGFGVTECGVEDVREARPGAPQVVLGHTRLAILDLSDRGAQPMRRQREALWITYNGEIYNFAEIRAELERAGYTFSSHTDTEVLLCGYEQWGEQVIDRLRGMFAFAIWDGRTQSLLIARDRLGIKPVYFYRDRHRFLFASEVRALLSSGMVPRHLDRVGLEAFLAYQSVPPPRTLVQGVEMLAPGTRLLVNGTGQIEERQYWDLLDASSQKATVDDAAGARQEVHRLLVESTALHLISDVPVGVFLSGGIDSSAIVALTREAGALPHTFSVVLPGSSEDESQYARTVADAFGAEHQEISLSADEFLRLLPEALAAVDHPSGDGVNTFAVARAVRAAGVKVALSGLGGDETFGGYPSFARMRRLAALTPVWKRSPMPVRTLAAAAVRAIGRDSVGASKTAAVLESDTTLPYAYPILRQLFDRAARAALLGTAVRDDDPYVALLRRGADRHPDADLMSLVSYAECRTYMHDVLLRDTDQMSMAHGLEVRVPLLDHRLVEYVVGLPGATKTAQGRTKPLLVDALAGRLPTASTGRPKQGFVLPFSSWMRGDLRAFCDRHLGASGLAGRDVLRAPAIQDLWQRYLAGDRSTTWSRPWTLVALNAWLEAARIES